MFALVAFASAAPFPNRKATFLPCLFFYSYSCTPTAVVINIDEATVTTTTTVTIDSGSTLQSNTKTAISTAETESPVRYTSGITTQQTVDTVTSTPSTGPTSEGVFPSDTTTSIQSNATAGTYHIPYE